MHHILYEDGKNGWVCPKGRAEHRGHLLSRFDCRLFCYVQMHHILYEDGENEWVCLPKEAHAWAPSLPSTAYPAGLAPGE